MSDVKNYADALNSAVGYELRAARRAADITQEQVISRTGLSKSTIIRIEKASKDINTREIALVADAIGIEPQVIMKQAQKRAAEELS